MEANEKNNVEMSKQKSRVVEKAILEPDHPLLEKFQKALKDHLVHHINKLKNEIFEIEAEAKTKLEEKENVGIRVYEAQQMVCKQQKTLEEVAKDLQNVTAAREEMENLLHEEKAKYKETREKLLAVEKNNLELQNEINSVNLLINQVAEWENRVESNITVNQRIAEKTRKDNLKLAEEKRKQDAQIYKVMKATWKLETEVETMNIQLKLKEAEIEELEQTAALGNTNLEALQAEYRCLMHSWNSVVVAIGNRDRIMDCLRSERDKVHVKIKSILCEIDQTKKMTKKCMYDHQRLTMNKAKAELDIKNSKQLLDDELQKYQQQEAIACKLQAVLQQTEMDISITNGEIHSKEMTTNAMHKAWEKVMAKKNKIEQRIMEDLMNQAANTKTAENLRRVLGIEKEKRKDLEIFLSEAENKQSLLIAEIEMQRFSNEESEKLLAEVEKEHSDLEKEADRLEATKNHYQMLFRKKERHVTVLNNKFEHLLEKRQDAALVSPQELKIIALEKQIEITQEKIKNLQLFWIREQRNLLNISKERQEQIYQLNLLKKQNLILEQKNLQVSNEIENYKKLEEKISRYINTLQNRACVLCDNLFKKRDRKTSLDNANYYLQSQYDGKLKDSEMDCMRIMGEISDLEDDKIVFSKELIDLNREALEWEKKVKLAKETRVQIRGEQGQSGELDSMKQEIQRMNVIYSQLKKAQDKLLKDLDHCVSRREAIFTVSEARQKRSKVYEERTRINFSRKMDDIRNQIKKHETDLKTVIETLENLDNEKFSVEASLRSVQGKMDFYHEYLKTLNDEIETRKTNRQLKFEMLLLLQKKLQIYNDLAAQKTPYVKYKKNQQTFEYEKEKDLNNRLCRVIENLMSDFPNYHHELLRLYNSLKLYVLTYSN